jgi:hypothetical protein
LLSFEAVFEIPKQERRKSQSQRELSPASTMDIVDVVQFAKKFSSQNAFATFAGCDLALSACTTSILLPLSTTSNNLDENISDIVGDCEYLSF